MSTVTAGPTVLLDFTATWCQPCQAMAPAVDQLVAAGLPVRKVDIDREPQLAAQFRVTGVPCFVMLVNGQEVDRESGVTSPARLKQMLSRALAGAPNAGPQSSGPQTAGGTPVQLVSGPAAGGGFGSRGRGGMGQMAASAAPIRGQPGHPYPLPPMQGGPKVSLAECVQIDTRPQAAPASAPASIPEEPLAHALASPAPAGPQPLASHDDPQLQSHSRGRAGDGRSASPGTCPPLAPSTGAHPLTLRRRCCWPPAHGCGSKTPADTRGGRGRSSTRPSTKL